MMELRRDYLFHLTAYERRARDAIRDPTPAAIEAVKEANTRVAAVLERMIEMNAQARQQTGDVRAERDELMAKLRRIQEDYNGLLRDTDTLRTLQRIREYEEAKADKSLYTYLIIFLVGCLVLLLVLVLRSGSQSTATAAPMPSNAAAMTPFT
jgi:NAD-specific glutamate dehydrogenase